MPVYLQINEIPIKTLMIILFYYLTRLILKLTWKNKQVKSIENIVKKKNMNARSVAIELYNN